MITKGITTMKGRRTGGIVIGTALGAVLLGDPAWPDDELANATVSRTRTNDATVRAQGAAVDLADGLRSVGSPLRSVGTFSAGAQGLTQEENDRLVEAAMRAELEGLADDLDSLSIALAADKSGAAAAELLQSINRRKADLLALAQTTRTPLIPSDELRAIASRWKDLDSLAPQTNPMSPSVEIEATP